MLDFKVCFLNETFAYGDILTMSVWLPILTFKYTYVILTKIMPSTLLCRLVHFRSYKFPRINYMGVMRICVLRSTRMKAFDILFDV
jgi:hypothetical protein